jgi:hypothetical protein
MGRVAGHDGKDLVIDHGVVGTTDDVRACGEDTCGDGSDLAIIWLTTFRLS